MERIDIGGTQVGANEQTFVIAEIGQAHDGSLGIAHSFIDSVAQTGVDAIKFQTHLARHESTYDEPFRTPFSYEDETRFDYWNRMEFTKDQWEELAAHARDEGLVFLSSAFCEQAVDLLSDVGVPAWKVGSGEYKSRELVSYMAETGLPILMSTGMSKYDEIDELLSTVEDASAPYALFQCTSKYPAGFEDIGLNVIEELRSRFGCPVGLSDHTGSIYPGMAAIGRGVDLLEVHVTFDRQMFGPDAEASLTMDELEMLCEMRDVVETMNNNPVDKDEMADSLSETRSLFSKSIAPARNLSSGTVLEEEMIEPKKPATGIPYEEKEKVLGKRLVTDVTPTRLLTWSDINE